MCGTVGSEDFSIVPPASSCFRAISISLRSDLAYCLRNADSYSRQTMATAITITIIAAKQLGAHSDDSNTE